ARLQRDEYAAESEQKAGDLSRRERLAKGEWRDDRHDERIGAGDDRPHSRRHPPERLVVEAEIERVAAGAEEEDLDPGLCVAWNGEPRRPGAREKQAARHQEAQRKDG